MVTKVLLLVMLKIWVGLKKPCFTFPGFGSGLDIHKAIGKLPRPTPP